MSLLSHKGGLFVGLVQKVIRAMSSAWVTITFTRTVAGGTLVIHFEQESRTRPLYGFVCQAPHPNLTNEIVHHRPDQAKLSNSSTYSEISRGLENSVLHIDIAPEEESWIAYDETRVIQNAYNREMVDPLNLCDIHTFNQVDYPSLCYLRQ